MSRTISSVLGRSFSLEFLAEVRRARAGSARRRVILRTVLAVLACASAFAALRGADAQTPSADDGVRAFRIVEKAVRSWELPLVSAPASANATEQPKAVGACVTLKLRGDVVGRGTGWSDVIAGPEAFSSEVLRRAIRDAMQQAEPKLGVPNDAMRDAAIKLVAPEILVSVELAGPLSVVELNTWEDAELSLRPGLDGVAVRLKGKDGTPGQIKAIFPSTMMLTNMLPHRAMGAATALALGEGGAAEALDNPRKLRTESGAVMYRFRTIQVVQAAGGNRPVVLYRGQELLGAGRALSATDLRESAERLFVNLARRVHTEPGLDSRLLASIAIENYSSLLGAGDADAHAIEDRRLRRDIERSLGAMPEGKVPLVTASLAAIARLDSTVQGGALLREASGRGRDRGVPITPSELGLVVLGEARDGRRNADGCAQEQVMREQTTTKAITGAFASTPEGHLVATMPWLGLAAIENGVPTRCQHALDARAQGPPETEVIAAIALRQMRARCWDHQISIAGANEDALDMIGGIVFVGAEGRVGNPYPTWQCVRPAAFIAAALRDARLTEPGERPEQIVRLMQIARFLRQLQVDESSAWMYPDPALAIGGIRASTWDSSLPVDATSMTLLFTVELIKSLDALTAEQSKPASAPALTPPATVPVAK